jgi:uncharacterized membrane protein YhaH (DUF805 family)
MFWDNFMLALRKTFDFNGRSRRAEFWWFIFITTMFSIGAAFWDNLLGMDEYLRDMVRTAFFVTTTAAAARRLHDTGRSGWWQLIGLTGIGMIPLIIWLAQDSDFEDNDFGDSPKYGLADLEREKVYEEDLLV